MHWLGYALGLVAGAGWGFWFYGIWEHDLTGIGSDPPPLWDFPVPFGLFLLTAGVLGLAARRR